MSAQALLHRLPVPGTVLLFAALAAGCGPGEAPVDPAADEAEAVVAVDGARRGVPASVELNRELAALRRVTEKFHRFEEAEAAGYTVLVTHPETGAACLSHSTEGAMGRHFLNGSLVNDEVSVTDPEIVIYEPMQNGKLRLVGFEYIIPYSIRGPDETPPTLFGQTFLHNPTFKLWMLHVYLWRDNPSGIFATWNPKITCEHDAAVGT